MQIRLKNIGIINDSTLALDGLTVITGKNNSGKTTVGKTLYAILDAVADVQKKAQIDRNLYIRGQLAEVWQTLTTGFRFSYKPEKSEFSRYPALCILLFGEDILNSLQDMEIYAHQFEEELRVVDSALMESYRINNLRYISEETAGGIRFAKPQEDFDVQRQQALALLERMFNALERDPDLVDYTRESINQTLRAEFSGQIQPVRAPDAASLVELSESGSSGPVYFHFSVEGNSIVNDGHPVFGGVPVKKVYMVDDPFILDDFNAPRHPARLLSHDMPEMIVTPTRIQTHNQKLKRALRMPATSNIFEQTVLDANLKTIREQIDSVVSGSFKFSEESNYYLQNGAKVKLGNMATGSKMFSIIKILLEKGELDGSTMLILDEPEAHLHPQWQNAFAEVIVLLVRELGVRVLLTTHSPNFMLALDAHMRKYDMGDRTNFYQTEAVGGGFVRYQCVNDNMERIYDDFLRYLSEMKELRDRYMSGRRTSDDQ
jgi:predicted ATP-dependent endonuclease of OLD family